MKLHQRTQWIATCAMLLCLMLTLAFPGFVWRYLRRQR